MPDPTGETRVPVRPRSPERATPLAQFGGLLALARSEGTEEGLRSILRAAMNECEADAGAIFLLDVKSRRLSVAAGAGLETAEDRPRLVAALSQAAERAMRERAARSPFENDLSETEEPASSRAVSRTDPYEEVVGSEHLRAEPIVLGRETNGAIVCRSKRCPPDGDPVLAFLAEIASLLIERSNRAAHAVAVEKELREARSHLVRAEKLAALGELSAKVAREIRAPIVSIGGFARKIDAMLPAGHESREFLDVIVAEAERVERILGEQLQFVDLSRPHLRMEDMNRVLTDSLGAVDEEIRGKKARLLKRLAPDLPPLLLDSDRIEQVFRNIFRNALQSLPAEGRLKVETKRIGEYAQALVASDRTRIPGDLLEQLFVPFASSRAGGSTLGLAVASQIVREHGGEIGVRSDRDWPAIFTVTFPIKRNADRRRRMRDRRGRRNDRRGALLPGP